MMGPVGSGDRRDPVPRAEVFDLLSSRRRRHVLHYLSREERPVSLKDLSRQLAAWEHGVDPEDVTYEQRKTVYTALRQFHLPRMDEAGVVDFDPDRCRVRQTDEARALRVHLEVVPADEIPWADFYLGLSAVAGLLVLAILADFFVFGDVPSVAWLGLVVGTFAASSAVHAYATRKYRLGSSGDPPGLAQERRNGERDAEVRPADRAAIDVGEERSKNGGSMNAATDPGVGAESSGERTVSQGEG